LSEEAPKKRDENIAACKDGHAWVDAQLSGRRLEVAA